MNEVEIKNIEIKKLEEDKKNILNKIESIKPKIKNFLEFVKKVFYYLVLLIPIIIWLLLFQLINNQYSNFLWLMFLPGIYILIYTYTFEYFESWINNKNKFIFKERWDKYLKEKDVLEDKISLISKNIYKIKNEIKEINNQNIKSDKEVNKYLKEIEEDYYKVYRQRSENVNKEELDSIYENSKSLIDLIKEKTLNIDNISSFSENFPQLIDFHNYAASRINRGDYFEIKNLFSDNKIKEKSEKINRSIKKDIEKEIKERKERITKQTYEEKLSKYIKSANTGNLGEEIIFNYEKSFLLENNRKDLSDKVHWFSRDKGEGSGYDILSFDLCGNQKFIEVKTSGSDNNYFFLSPKEKLFLENNNNAFIYSILIKDNKFEDIKIISSENFSNSVELKIYSYQAKINNF